MNSTMFPAASLSWADCSASSRQRLSGSHSIRSLSRHGLSHSATDRGVCEKRLAVLFLGPPVIRSIAESADERPPSWRPRSVEGLPSNAAFWRMLLQEVFLGVMNDDTVATAASYSTSVSGQEIQPFTRIAHRSCSISVDQRKQIIVDRQCGATRQ